MEGTKMPLRVWLLITWLLVYKPDIVTVRRMSLMFGATPLSMERLLRKLRMLDS